MVINSPTNSFVLFLSVQTLLFSELSIHKTLCSNLIYLITMLGWCSGQHSCISCRSPRFNSPYELSYFQLSFFSFSSFWDHQTFLFKISSLRNYLFLNGSVISLVKGTSIKAYLLLQGLS